MGFHLQLQRSLLALISSPIDLGSSRSGTRWGKQTKDLDLSFCLIAQEGLNNDGDRFPSPSRKLDHPNPIVFLRKFSISNYCPL